MAKKASFVFGNRGPTSTSPLQYEVTEIFDSMQGEGYWTGTPATFIRLAGCNLRCKWCDTKFERKMTLEVPDIMPFIHHHLVVITGGEPALQVLDPLVRELQLRRHYVQVETNGTRKIDATPNWVTVSPKQGMHDTYHGHELKIVFVGQRNYELMIWQAVERYKYFRLQPCERNGEMNWRDTLAMVTKLGPPWRMSLQTHKMIGVK
jgi:organic radical activating enzyme